MVNVLLSVYYHCENAWDQARYNDAKPAQLVQHDSSQLCTGSWSKTNFSNLGEPTPFQKCDIYQNGLKV